LSGFLLDTNILSELQRRRPEPRVLAFIARQKLNRLFVSAVSLAEIRFGIERVAEPLRRTELQDWLTNRIRPIFARRVLPVTEDIMLKWRLLAADGRKSGHTYLQPDLIIGATALCHDLVVVTRDVADFERAGVPLCNPWMLEA